MTEIDTFLAMTSWAQNYICLETPGVSWSCLSLIIFGLNEGSSLSSLYPSFQS